MPSTGGAPSISPDSAGNAWTRTPSASMPCSSYVTIAWVQPTDAGGAFTLQYSAPPQSMPAEQAPADWSPSLKSGGAIASVARWAYGERPGSSLNVGSAFDAS